MSFLSANTLNIAHDAHQYFKSDKCFRQAYDKLKKNYQAIALIHASKLLMLLVYLLIDLTLFKANFNLLIVTIIIAIIVSIALLICFMFAISQMFTSVRKFIQAANQMNHVSTEIAYNYESYNQVTSENVFAFNQSQVGLILSAQLQNTYINITVKEIEQYNRNKYQCLCSTEVCFNILAIIFAIFAVVSLSVQSNSNVGQIIVVTFYIVLEAVSKPRILMVLLMLAVSPFICLIICIYMCFCNKPKGQFIEIRQTEAHFEHIVLCGGQCAICLQNIVVKDLVYMLPCSEKHLFHSNCLNNWAKVKPTCPSCRARIPMTNVPVEVMS